MGECIHITYMVIKTLTHIICTFIPLCINCTHDFFFYTSLFYFQFFTSWPIPKDDFGWSLLTIYNVGTVQTCTAQGFFVHMSMGTLMYNCCMSLYYLLIIRYNWSNERFAKRVEPFMHVFSIGFPLVTGIFLLATNSFNPAGKRSRCFSPSCYTNKFMC